MMKSTIKVSEANQSTIVGIQNGPSIAQIRQAMREEFENLMTQTNNLNLSDFQTKDPIAQALYLCESESGSSLGFSVNNSGLIVCSSIIAPVQTATHLTSNQAFSVEYIERQNLLSAIQIHHKTRGLVPSYSNPSQVNFFNEDLFVFNAEGGRSPLRIDCINLTSRIYAPKQKFIIKNGFGAWFDPSQKLMGGPVMNEAEEVIGVAIGSSNRGFLIAQPWVSVVSNCIEMEVEVSK